MKEWSGSIARPFCSVLWWTLEIHDCQWRSSALTYVDIRWPEEDRCSALDSDEGIEAQCHITGLPPLTPSLSIFSGRLPLLAKSLTTLLASLLTGVAAPLAARKASASVSHKVSYVCCCGEYRPCLIEGFSLTILVTVGPPLLQFVVCCCGVPWLGIVSGFNTSFWLQKMYSQVYLKQSPALLI